LTHGEGRNDHSDADPADGYQALTDEDGAEDCDDDGLEQGQGYGGWGAGAAHAEREESVGGSGGEQAQVDHACKRGQASRHKGYAAGQQGAQQDRGAGE